MHLLQYISRWFLWQTWALGLDINARVAFADKKEE
jgi:hypothetical protein